MKQRSVFLKKIKKVLIIGSGPIIIGQAAEFDYSGTQACLSFREAGIKTVLVNSNPATIQTDHEISDIVYIEPLTPTFLEKIIIKERPDSLIATVGGQIGLNLAVALSDLGILKKYSVQVIGTDIKSIKIGEDRKLFKLLMNKIHQPMIPSRAVSNISSSVNFANKNGFPVIIRSAFNLGGKGSGIAQNKRELERKVQDGLNASPIKQVLVEKSAVGWSEIEYEIIRDKIGNKICVCNMENIDPMGVHTGDSIVVAPSQTLSNDDYQLLRTAAFSIVDAIDIQGACNVQFAFNQKTGQYYVIEINPRLSRSSALASKATGYPIARIAAKISLGKTLPEITNDITGKTAFFEPTVDYLVVKIPRWPDDKFNQINQDIGITMKSTGEVMAIGRSFEEALFKAIASLDIKNDVFTFSDHLSKKDIKQLLIYPTMRRLSSIFTAFKLGFSNKSISRLTNINPWFIYKMRSLYFNREKIENKIEVFKMVDTCSAEFEAKTPYFYSTFGSQNEAISLPGPKVIILGSGPIRIGQGIEFDYLTVHAIKALREKGIKTIIINNNPETVSTDYSISDRLYFEPLTKDFIMRIIENEQNGLVGVIPQFGGQTAINQVDGLAAAGIKILGTPPASIQIAEDRNLTAQRIKKLGYLIPSWEIGLSKEEIILKAKLLGYPVLIRPSFVIGGEGIIIAHSEKEVLDHLNRLPTEIFNKSILIDKFLENALEVDIDVVCDGKQTLSFILEQIESAGIHSGDSSCVFPPQNLDITLQTKLQELAHTISLDFGILGLANIQCAIIDKKIYVLEINPRGSRTVPFLSKCLGFSLAKLATQIIMGEKLPKSIKTIQQLVAVKTPVFSFDNLDDLSQSLGPLMKSTGEKMSFGRNYEESYSKNNGVMNLNTNFEVYQLHNNGIIPDSVQK